MAVVLNEQSDGALWPWKPGALGRGGVSLMARIPDWRDLRIYHGISDIRDDVWAAPGRIRKDGGGRKKKHPRTQPFWSSSNVSWSL